LQAALNPARTCSTCYYVIADANGKHAFATTLDEHNQNVEAPREGPAVSVLVAS
jgi:cell division protein YceG involved in septum cleavage